MSNTINLIQRIRSAAVALQQAKDAGDIELAETLEDELFELEEQLEEEQEAEYDDKHQHGWY